MTSSRLLLLISALHGLAANVAEVLLSLYIWRLADLQTVMVFKILELLVIPVAGFLVSWMSDRLNPKYGLSLGLGLFSVQLLLIVWLGEQVPHFLLPLALLSGASVVCRYMSLNVLFRTAIAPKQQPPFYGKMSTLFKVIEIAFPILSGVVIWKFGYSPLFILALAAVVAASVLLKFVKTTFVPNAFSPVRLFKDWNNRSTAVFFTQLWWGVEFAFFVTLIPVLITRQMNGEFGWGVATTVLNIVGIVATFYVLSKTKLANRLELMRLGGILLSVAALMYATLPSFDYLLFLLILLQLWQVLQNISIRPFINALIRQQPQAATMVSEYSYLLEVPFMVGRLIMYVLLWLVSPLIDNTMMLVFLFFIISIVPVNEARSLLSGSKR